MAEIKNRLNVCRQRVQQLARRDDFPEPYQELIMGRVWLESEVEAWIRNYRPD
jgi:predicted DNA-binding transcriptional regulator AlpA